MKNRLPLLLAFAVIFTGLPATAQDPPRERTAPEDTSRQNRFWQATLPGGHYMVEIGRITSVSRHKYVLDGAVIVDEVVVDSMGQSLARFYYIEPITAATGGGAAGAAAGRLVDRGTELLDKAARTAGTEIHEMVVKKFPETTHARTIEYRLMSAEQLTALHRSVRTAWESRRGRSFTVN